MSAAEVEDLAAICFSVSATFLIVLSMPALDEIWGVGMLDLAGVVPFYLPDKLSLKELEGGKKEDNEFSPFC